MLPLAVLPVSQPRCQEIFCSCPQTEAAAAEPNRLGLRSAVDLSFLCQVCCHLLSSTVINSGNNLASGLCLVNSDRVFFFLTH